MLVDEEMVLLGCFDCLILTQGQLHSMMVEEFCCHLDFVFHLYVHHKILKAKKNDRGLRQVSGINYLIPISTYRLPCGDREITWVG